MRRFTTTMNGKCAVPEAELPQALQRLAALEDMLDTISLDQTNIPIELASLKSAGKEKTVRYKELLGQKLILNQIIALLERHGIQMDYRNQNHPTG